MKIAVCMDEDGHFKVAHLEDRRKVVEMISKIQGGDFVANMYQEDLEKFDNAETLSPETWREYISGLQQRATLEIIDL